MIEQILAGTGCGLLIIAGILTSVKTGDLWFGIAEICVGLANIKFMIGWP